MSPEESAELAKKYAGKSGKTFQSVLAPEPPPKYDIIAEASKVAEQAEAQYGQGANPVLKTLNFRSVHSNVDLDRFNPGHPQAYLKREIGPETAWQRSDSRTEVARTDTVPKNPDDRVIFERPTPGDPLTPRDIIDQGSYIEVHDALTGQETIRMSTVPDDRDDRFPWERGDTSLRPSDDEILTPAGGAGGGGTPPEPPAPPSPEGGGPPENPYSHNSYTEIEDLWATRIAEMRAYDKKLANPVLASDRVRSDANENLRQIRLLEDERTRLLTDPDFARALPSLDDLLAVERNYIVLTGQELLTATSDPEKEALEQIELFRTTEISDNPRLAGVLNKYYEVQKKQFMGHTDIVAAIERARIPPTPVMDEAERRHREQLRIAREQIEAQERRHQEQLEAIERNRPSPPEPPVVPPTAIPGSPESNPLLTHDASIKKDFRGYILSAVERVEANIGDAKTVTEIAQRMEAIAGAQIPPFGFSKEDIDAKKYNEVIWLAQARVALHEAQKTVRSVGFADFAEWKKHTKNLINADNRGFYLRHLLGEAEDEDPVTGEKRTERLPFLFSAIDEVKTYRRTEDYDGVDCVLNYYQAPGESSIREDINEQIANEILRPGEDETLRRVPAYYSKLATQLLGGTRRPADVERKARELFNQNIDTQKEEIKADLFNKGQATPETPEADLNKLVNEALKKRFIKALTISDGLYRVTGVAARMNGPVYDYQYLKNAWTSFQTNLSLYSADEQLREFKTKHEISEFDNLATLTRTDEELRKAWHQFMIDKPVVTESGRKTSFKDRYCLSPDIDIDQTVNDESLVANRTTIGLVDEKSILPEVMTRREWNIRHQNMDKLHVEVPPAPLTPPKRSIGQRFSGFFERAMSVQPLTDGSNYYPDLNGYDTDPAPTIDPNKVEVYPSKFDALFTDAKFTYAGDLGILAGAGNESWKQLLYGPVYAEAKDSIKSKQLLPLANFRRQDLFSYVNNMARHKDARGANVDITVNDFDDLYLALTTTAKLGKEIGTKQLNGWLNSVGDSADSLKNFYATGDNPGGILLNPFGESGASNLLRANHQITEAERKNSSAGELQKKYIALGEEVEKIVNNLVSTAYKALPGIDVAKGADLLYIMGKMSTYMTTEEAERDHRTRLGPEAMNYFNRYFFENPIIRKLPLPDSDETARKIKDYLNKGFMEWHNYETEPQKAFRITQNTRTSLTALVSEIGKTLGKIK